MSLPPPTSLLDCLVDMKVGYMCEIIVRFNAYSYSARYIRFCNIGFQMICFVLFSRTITLESIS